MPFLVLQLSIKSNDHLPSGSPPACLSGFLPNCPERVCLGMDVFHLSVTSDRLNCLKDSDCEVVLALESALYSCISRLFFYVYRLHFEVRFMHILKHANDFDRHMFSHPIDLSYSFT